MADSMFYDKDKYLEMEAQNKRMMHLLASAEEETEQTEAEVARLRGALEVNTCGIALCGHSTVAAPAPAGEPKGQLGQAWNSSEAAIVCLPARSPASLPAPTKYACSCE